jgi:hypothetical protein
MQRNTYIYENRMFTNKVQCSIILDQKEKAIGANRKVLALSKCLIYPRVERGTWGVL